MSDGGNRVCKAWLLGGWRPVYSSPDSPSEGPTCLPPSSWLACAWRHLSLGAGAVLYLVLPQWPERSLRAGPSPGPGTERCWTEAVSTQ